MLAQLTSAPSIEYPFAFNELQGIKQAEQVATSASQVQSKTQHKQTWETVYGCLWALKFFQSAVYKSVPLFHCLSLCLFHCLSLCLSLLSRPRVSLAVEQ